MSTLDLRMGQKLTSRGTQFFKPNEFVSKKLKMQYEEVMDKLEKIEPYEKSKEKKKLFKNEREYFEALINKRRIIKLGPKKRILYQRKAI